MNHIISQPITDTGIVISHTKKSSVTQWLANTTVIVSDSDELTHDKTRTIITINPTVNEQYYFSSKSLSSSYTVNTIRG